MRRAILLEDVGRQLAELLSDPVESVREAALALAARLLAEDGAAAAPGLLLLLLPVLTARVASAPPAEEAEELRLQWAQLLGALLALREPARSALAAGSAFEDVCEALRALAGDAFHSIKCEALAAVVRLGEAAPGRVAGVLGALAGACVGCLGHQRGPVRAAALAALQATLPLGGESLPAVLADAVLPALRAHARFDRTPSVRRALAGALGHWLGGALPLHALRAQRAEPALLYLLAGLLADETPEVAEAALAALEGAAAARSNSSSSSGGSGSSSSDAAPLSSDLAAAAAAAAPDALQPGYSDAAALAERTAGALSGGGAAGAGDALAPAGALPPPALPAALLPAPFAAHPSAPLRALAARLLPAALATALAELKDWTTKTRTFAAGALRSLLVLGEGGALVALEGCIEALCAGSRDEEAGVRTLLGEVGRLMGAVIHPSAQLGVLLPALRAAAEGGGGGGGGSGGVRAAAAVAAAASPPPQGAHASAPDAEPSAPAISSPSHLAATLAVLATLLSTVARPHLLPLLTPLAETLAMPHLAALEPPALRTHLAMALAYTVECLTSAGASSDASSELSQPALDALLLTVLHLSDGSAGAEATAAAARAGARLAAFVGLAPPTLSHLMGSAAARLLPRVAAQCARWERGSVPRRAFDTLLRVHRGALAGGAPLAAGACGALVGGALEALAASLAPSRDAELRLVQLVLLDAFVQGGEGGGGGEEGEGAGEGAARRALVDAAIGEWAPRLLKECLLPNLVWRGGMVASTIRKVSVAGVLSLSGGHARLLPAWAARAALPELLPVLKSCLGDDDATTRHLSCRAAAALLARVGPGGLAGDAVRALYPELLKRLDDSNDAVRSVGCAAIAALPAAARPADAAGMPAEYSIDTLLVHLDDGDAEVQAAVYGALSAWCAVEPAYAARKAGEVRERMRHTAYVDKLLAYAVGLVAAGGGRRRQGRQRQRPGRAAGRGCPTRGQQQQR